MANLADWLEIHMDTLVAAALAELSQDENQQFHAADLIMEFFQAVHESLRSADLTALFEVLENWALAQSAPTEDEFTRLVPVVVKLKQVQAHHIGQLSNDADTVDLLYEMETIYDPAVIHIAHLEAEGLLKNMRRQLYDARVELDRLDKSKSDFIEVAAHELRTPITLVEGYTNMLRGSIPGLEDNADVQPLLYGIEGGVNRLREIIRDMLDVSLISLGMMELREQPVWLPQIVNALEHHVREALNERDIELVIEHDLIPPEPILGDPERLMQVLQKITFNAIKYTPDGGKVIVTARQLTSFTDVMVIDNGIGIDPENISRIFGMFSSIGDTSLHSSGKTKFRGGGPGLGLYISKGLIEAHGGNVWAESPGYDEETNPGSTFHIMIPMRHAAIDGRQMAMTEQDE